MGILDIDFSEINPALDAVWNYEVYRQMLVRVSKVISSQGENCLIYTNHHSCLEKHWEHNTLLKECEDNLEEGEIMTYNKMCKNCQYTQALVNERKRIKFKLGVAKTTLARVGSKMIRENLGEDGELLYDPFSDENINPLKI